MMKLYGVAGSPFMRKALVTVHELGLQDRVELTEIDFRGTLPAEGGAPELLAANPLSKIPTLLLEDGRAVFESDLVCEYLDTLHDRPKLFPDTSDMDAWWKARYLCALADGMIEAQVLRTHEAKRPEHLRSADWDDKQKGKIWRGLARAEEQADMLDGPVTIGPIAMASALEFFVKRLDDELGWTKDHPRLVAWTEEFGQRPSMIATRPW